jgi:multicomponent Na+:H+ antiporter subunit D
MLLGLALNSTLALAGAVFYLIHHIVVKANLFLVSGVVRRVGGSFELPRLGGIYRTHGFLALLFFIPAFSLAGFPPLSGFWAKMILIRASIEIDQFLLAAVAAAVGLYTVYSMTKIWGEVFWKPAPADESGQTDSVRRPSGWMIAPIVLLALLTVMMGLGVEPLFKIASTASEELRNPDMYLIAVLGVK